MKTIRMTSEYPLLIEDRHYSKGEVVLVRDERADELVKAGVAEPADGKTIQNPEVNHLADAIDPAPPAQALPLITAPLVAPQVAIPQVVEQNPGLVELEKATKAGKPKAAHKD
jgi:hypothetical protein